MSTDVENEAQGATGASPLIPQGDSSSPVPGTDRMTFAEKVTTAVLSLLGTMTVTMLGLALKRKKQAQGTEDAAWGISTETLQRQQMQIEALQKELDTVRTQRNEFEAASIRAEANSRAAAEAAQRAADLATRNEAELANAQHNWEKAQRYIRILRTALVNAGLDVPPEPA